MFGTFVFSKKQGKKSTFFKKVRSLVEICAIVVYNIKYSTNFEGALFVKTQRLLTILLILTLAVSVCLLTACGCSHENTKWETTENYHKLVCADCGEFLSTSENHQWDGTNCTICDIGDGYSKGLTYELSSNGAYYTVTGAGTFLDTHLNIAPYFNGKPVQKIGASAFCDEDKITGDDNIMISEVLEEVTIPSTVTYIGEMAFDWIDNLSKVNFAPDSQLETIGRLAFAYNYNLVDITIPATVMDVKENAFVQCQGLTIKCQATSKPATWHNNWNVDNNPVVWNSDNNERANDGNIYVIVDGVRFALASGQATVAKQIQALTNGHIPAKIEHNGSFYNVTQILTEAFREEPTERAEWHLKTLTIDPECKLTRISDRAFENCVELKAIALPDTVNYLGESCFRHCWDLEEFVIPAAVTTIPSQAFWCCESLATITIHANVTKIKSAAFVYCYGLQTVVFENTTGWTVDGFDSVTGEPFSQTIKSSDLANVQTAAQLLKEDHVLCDWIRA